MDLESVRLIVRRKLVSGDLPQDSISRFWGGLSNGEDCDACEEPIRGDQFIVEAISTTTHHGLQFHIGCFYMWDAERDPSGSSIMSAAGRRIAQPKRYDMPRPTEQPGAPMDAVSR